MAARSRFGVRSRGLPCRPTVSHRCWSVKNKITFGRSRAELVLVSSVLVPVISIGIGESYLVGPQSIHRQHSRRCSN